jgi:hypothetical protein
MGITKPSNGASLIPVLKAATQAAPKAHAQLEPAQQSWDSGACFSVVGAC